jgi:hypothetical protein
MALLLLASALLMLPFLHHGHIEMFISDVRRALAEHGVANRRVRQKSSMLEIASAAPSMRYAIAVRRKTRAVETSLQFEGTREEVDAWLELLAHHEERIRSKLGPEVEPERMTRTSARLLHMQIVSESADWSPKRDLTPDLAIAVEGLLEDFIEVLEPIVAPTRRTRA